MATAFQKKLEKLETRVNAVSDRLRGQTAQLAAATDRMGRAKTAESFASKVTGRPVSAFRRGGGRRDGARRSDSRLMEEAGANRPAWKFLRAITTKGRKA